MKMTRNLLIALPLLTSLTLEAREKKYGTYEPEVTVEMRSYANFSVKNGEMTPAAESGLRELLAGYNVDSLITELKLAKNVSGSCVSTNGGEPICEVEYENKQNKNGNINGAIVSGGANRGDIEIIKIKGPCSKIPLLIQQLREIPPPQEKGE